MKNQLRKTSNSIGEQSPLHIRGGSEMLQYIYDLNQANFYISKGVKPVEIGIHDKTKKTFVVFKREELTPIFYEWKKIDNPLSVQK